jgi:hypothetical protein
MGLRNIFGISEIIIISNNAFLTITIFYWLCYLGIWLKVMWQPYRRTQFFLPKNSYKKATLFRCTAIHLSVSKSTKLKFLVKSHSFFNNFVWINLVHLWKKTWSIIIVLFFILIRKLFDNENDFLYIHNFYCCFFFPLKSSMKSEWCVHYNYVIYIYIWARVMCVKWNWIATHFLISSFIHTFNRHHINRDRYKFKKKLFDSHHY